MNRNQRGVRRPVQAAVALVLGLASHAALALDLGDIRVLSRPGQPLLAEIPVVSDRPDDLVGAQVGLAPLETFARVGLAVPDALVAGLRFDMVAGSDGQPVIRVTSAEPVNVPAVGFLVEMQWGQGRLVREYSALVDRPQTAQSVAQSVEAPVPLSAGTIIRDPALPEAPAQGDRDPVNAVEETAAPVAAAETGTADPVHADLPTPTEAPGTAGNDVPGVPSPPAGAAAQPVADTTLVVKPGQTLSAIAAGIASRQGVSRQQAMVALLEANPDAFSAGSMHLLRAGARLQIPDAAAMSSISQQAARAEVGRQHVQWVENKGRLSRDEAPARPQADSSKVEAASVASGGARLRIETAPDDKATATQSGIQPGGQGDRLVAEQLRQAQEDLAVRDAEIAELRERVAELEKLKEQQQDLIALKDNEMAAVQQQLAQRPDGAPETAPAGWLWGSGLLMALAGAAWWWRRRRKAAAPVRSLALHGGLATDLEPDTSSEATVPSADAFLNALRKAREEEELKAQAADEGTAAAPEQVINERDYGDATPASEPAGRDPAPVAASAEPQPEPVIRSEPEVEPRFGSEPEYEPVVPVTAPTPAASDVSVTGPAEVEQTSAVRFDSTPREDAPAVVDVPDFTTMDAPSVAAQALDDDPAAADQTDVAVQTEMAAQDNAGQPVDQVEYDETDVLAAPVDAPEALIAPVAPEAEVIVADAVPVVPAAPAAPTDEDITDIEVDQADGGPAGDGGSASLPLRRGSQERLELALAYLDLGDPSTARTLLEEVLTLGDPAATAKAQALLDRMD